MEYFDVIDLISSDKTITASFVWIIMSVFVALIGGIALYFCFTDKEFRKKLNGKAKKIVEFLSFEKNILVPALKISYLVLTIFITLFSIMLIRVSFFSFLTTLIFGNLSIRIAYEMIMLFVNLTKNVKDIKKGLRK